MILLNSQFFTKSLLQFYFSQNSPKYLLSSNILSVITATIGKKDRKVYLGYTSNKMFENIKQNKMHAEQHLMHTED